MRLNLLTVPAVAALAVAGCAPESMASHAVPAQHAPPSAITSTMSPGPSPSADEATAGDAADEEVMVQMEAEESPTPEPVVTPTSAPPTPAPATVAAQDPAPSVQPVSAKPEPSQAAPRPAASVTPTAPAAGSQWRDVNLDNLTYSDADQLTAVSPSFRDYAVQAMSAADTDGCTVLGLSVLSVHPAGFVVGSVSTDCGGGQAIWAEHDEQWKVAMVLQAPPLCTELSSIGLPAGVGLLCDDGAAKLSEY